MAFTEENRQIDLITNRLEKLVSQKTDIEDQIEDEMSRLEEEFKAVNKQNYSRVSHLQELIEDVPVT